MSVEEYLRLMKTLDDAVERPGLGHVPQRARAGCGRRLARQRAAPTRGSAQRRRAASSSRRSRTTTWTTTPTRSSSARGTGPARWRGSPATSMAGPIEGPRREGDPRPRTSPSRSTSTPHRPLGQRRDRRGAPDVRPGRLHEADRPGVTRPATRDLRSPTPGLGTAPRWGRRRRHRVGDGGPARPREIDLVTRGFRPGRATWTSDLGHLAGGPPIEGGARGPRLQASPPPKRPGLCRPPSPSAMRCHRLQHRRIEGTTVHPAGRPSPQQGGHAEGGEVGTVLLPACT